MRYMYLFVLLVLLFMPTRSAMSALQDDVGQLITLSSGEKTTVELAGAPDRVDIGKSGIVDILMPHPRVIELTGTSPGSTTIVVELEDGSASRYTVAVKPVGYRQMKLLADHIRGRLNQINQLDYQVYDEKIHISGRVLVDQKDYFNRSVSLFENYIENKVVFYEKQQEETVGKLANVTDLGSVGDQKPMPEVIANKEHDNSTQLSDEIKRKCEAPTVQIDVQIIEVDLGKVKRMGVQWFSGNTPWVASTGVSSSLGYNSNQTSKTTTTVSSTGNVTTTSETKEKNKDMSLPLTSHAEGNLKNISASFIALQDKGVAQLLSTPKLTVRSGDSANFLVGGEVPISNTTAMSSTVEYKKYGTQLQVTPEVLPTPGNIAVKIKATISSLDQASGVNGNPALKSKETETFVTVRDGSTFTLAGLVQRTDNKKASKVPLLGDIPLLGRVFRYNETDSRDMETVIIMTPRILSDLSNAEGLLIHPGIVPPKMLKTATDLSK